MSKKSGPLSGLKILVVDDEANVREMLKITLESYNYRAISANDGIEAIATYTTYQDDIRAVLIDMMMPLMDGLTAVRELKRLNSDVKTIVSSGLVSSERAAQFADIGVRSFLAKPYTATELLDTLQQVLRAEI